ncbi:hypothetical protein BCL57_002535 [Agromyces flavus]|uniref:Uncharacterized protein n=1 Tax=Agromyces flavus TaxID=589382 RepID=A0A1H1TT47_9MICO|nr:hypothetical protein [Agromyces flavus]SDS63382.1 hypothetical protein SAMN04489721_1639 [Agromyces flavus]
MTMLCARPVRRIRPWEALGMLPREHAVGARYCQPGETSPDS